jgi:hypothetical protein
MAHSRNNDVVGECRAVAGGLDQNKIYKSNSPFFVWTVSSLLTVEGLCKNFVVGQSDNVELTIR